MSPVRDANLSLRKASDGALTASATLAAFDLKGTPLKGLALQVIVPAVDDSATDILAIEVHAGSDSDARIVSKWDAITGTGESIVPFSTNERYVTVALTVSGATPGFGAVLVDIVENVGWMWNRATSHFDETTPSDT